MITLLGGAKKNIGDFLIVERARGLIRRITGETQLLEIDRWKPFDERIDEVNSGSAVFICGGPAYQRNFYPGLMPLVKDLKRIKVPIIPIGLGLGGMRPAKLKSFEFTPESLGAIRAIHETCVVSGVRDSLALETLQKNGIRNVVMSGCPAMYDFDWLGHPLRISPDIGRIVFTPPANRKLFPQCVRLARLLRRRFPKAEITACFHRGLTSDEHTPFVSALRSKILATALKACGLKLADVAYDLKKIEFYKECDLHVGYRVHAHVMFNSMARPSFLLQEDLRGVGLSATLGLDKIDVFVHAPGAIETLMQRIDREALGGFEGFRSVSKTIEETFRTMELVVSQVNKGRSAKA